MQQLLQGQLIFLTQMYAIVFQPEILFHKILWMFFVKMKPDKYENSLNPSALQKIYKK